MRHAKQMALAVTTILITMLGATARAAGPEMNAAGASAIKSFTVQVSGHGQPMILIPGLASSGETWKSTVERYRDRFECHVLTLAGFAGVPPIDEPVLAAARRDLAVYLRERQLTKPVLVGHSLGGTLALALAADHPQLVGPTVIVDGLPFLAGAQMGVKTAAEAIPVAERIRQSLASQSPEQYRAYVDSGASTRFMVTSDSDHDVVLGWSRTSDPRTVGSAMADLFELDLRQDVARIEAPVLVVGSWAGLRDQLKAYGTTLTRNAVLSQFRDQFAQVRQLRFVLSDTARHFIMFDTPEWFFAQLDAFLSDPASAVRDRGLPSAPARQ